MSQVNQRRRKVAGNGAIPRDIKAVHSLGFPVFPQRHDRGGYVKWKQYRDVPPTLEQIRKWHRKHNDALWAIITGQETGLIILDFDGAEGLETLDHLGLEPTVKSSGGGRHVWVEAPDFPVRSGARVDEERFPGLDVKAQGGCATFFGERNGGRYQCDPDVIYEWEDLPAELREMLEHRSKLPEAQQVEIPEDFDGYAPQNVLLREAVKRARPGNRNETGFWLACQLRDERYSEDEALETLKRYANRVTSVGESPYTPQEAYNTVISAYSEPPRTPRGLRPIDGPGPDLNVSNAAEMADWLRMEVGRGLLSGMFRRGEFIVHTPRIGEEGYRELSHNAIVDPVTGAVRHDSDGPAQIQRIDHGNLAARVQYSYSCFRIKEDRTRQKAMFPTAAAYTACNAVDLLPNLRRLRGVSHTPFVRADGSIFNSPGYDEQSQMLYLPDNGLLVPPVPDKPSRREVKDAVALLDLMTDGFPYVTEHDRANFYGALLTPLLRDLAPPPYMAVMFEAPMRGAGKSLQAQLLRIVHGGVLRVEMPEDSGELRKQISSILGATTGPVVEFDNVTGTLRSSVLAGLLTSLEWSDRTLGKNEYPRHTNDRLWVFTGNNASIGGDLGRRTFLVTIDPGIPHPHTRSGFKIQLPSWAEENRGKVIAALLTLIRAWVAAGRPKPGSGRSDSYAVWVSTVRGILSNPGVPGDFTHPDRSQLDAGVDDEDWGECLAAIHRVFGSEPWTAKRLLARVQGESGMAKLSDGDPVIDLDSLPVQVVDKIQKVGNSGASKSLGWWMRNHRNRYAGGYVVREAGEDGKNTKLWRVEKYDSS